MGIEDTDVLARVFVALTALLHFGAGMVLFHLLVNTISIGTAVASAGAFLFVPGVVWGRVWGMENSLYALLLTSTVAYFHLCFLDRETKVRALLLGILLGLTALARLNAVFFVGCLLLYFGWRTTRNPITERLRLIVVAGGTASLFVVGFALWNYSATGHFLPVSGAVKALKSSRFLEEHQLNSRFSLGLIPHLVEHFRGSVAWFVMSRVMDGTWIAGGRVLFNGGGKIQLSSFLTAVSLFTFAPFPLGKPRQWLRHVWDCFRRLSPVVYVLVFGVVDAIVSVFLYPTELGYAMIRLVVRRK